MLALCCGTTVEVLQVHLSGCAMPALPASAAAVLSSMHTDLTRRYEANRTNFDSVPRRAQATFFASMLLAEVNADCRTRA